MCDNCGILLTDDCKNQRLVVLNDHPNCFGSVNLLKPPVQTRLGYVRKSNWKGEGMGNLLPHLGVVMSFLPAFFEEFIEDA